MNLLPIAIAGKHLMARKRQSFVSLLGIILGVGFFLGISAMMQGSENDFIKRLVDNSPHISISDEYRNPHAQPVQQVFLNGAVALHGLKPETESRGIRGYVQLLQFIRRIPGAQAAATLNGQALINFAGKDVAVTLNGIVPDQFLKVSTIESFMTEGTLGNLAANPDGIVVGSELMRVMYLRRGEQLTLTAPTGQVHTFKIVGVFHTGRAAFDEGEAFVTLKRVQSMLNRPNRVNSIVVKLANSDLARDVAARIEAQGGYKAVSWQEASADLMSTLSLRRIIMYSVVGAVLLVAAFGIYNIISTVVMEKQRDIAILKAIGFHASDIEEIFVMQGIILGIVGAAAGLPLGVALMLGFSGLSFKFPGSSDVYHLPMDWSWHQFAIAGGFAVLSATLAAYLPARKAAHVEPVEILRGAA